MTSEKWQRGVKKSKVTPKQAYVALRGPGGDGSKILKQFTENMDQEIFKDNVQFLRFDEFVPSSFIL
jgi:hypothetical protein